MRRTIPSRLRWLLSQRTRRERVTAPTVHGLKIALQLELNTCQKCNRRPKTLKCLTLWTYIQSATNGILGGIMPTVN